MTVRAMFYERDDADLVAARLLSDGFTAETARERLAGEDDDEDHPWVVVTDAPPLVVAVLAERYDGWLEQDPVGDGSVDDPAGSGVPPLELPRAPRRVKNHFGGG